MISPFVLQKYPKSFLMCEFLPFIASWTRLTSPFNVSKSASDDLENPDQLRSLLKDLREARQAKSRNGLKTLDHSELSVRLLEIRVM